MLILALPLLMFVLVGRPLVWEMPSLTGFNFTGGASILPELAALWIALSLYTASFIAEIVRSGILAVDSGQTEAASALGLRSNFTLRLVVIPQAMRVIIPPLTSQYLNLVKLVAGNRDRLSRLGIGVYGHHPEPDRTGG